MGLFDAFTGDAYKDAAAQQRNYLTGVSNQVTGQLAGAQQQGLGLLQSGQYGGTNAIQQGTAAGRAAISGATDPALTAVYGGTDAATGYLTGGQDQAISALDTGVSTARGDYAPVSALSGQYANRSGAASDASADALGLNGPEGIARSRAAFAASPGYQFALEQGLEGIRRTGNASRNVGGNVLRAGAEYATNAANQEFGKYQDRLMGREQLYSPLALTGTTSAAGGLANAALTGGTGAANIYTGTAGRLADLSTGAGKAAADIYTGQGARLADLESTGGQSQANIYGNTGAQGASLVQGLAGQGTNFAGQIAPAYGSTYGAEAAAQTAASKNLWDLIMSGAKTGTKLLAA